MSVKQIFNTSAELDYPTVLPTLDLDFANSKTLDPRITFTRASGGSYVGADGLIKLAGVNEARFDHDPYTGESLGLLIEESRTNLLTYSEQFNDASWTKGNVGVTTNTLATTAPDGTNTAEKLIESLDVGATFHTLNKSGGFSATSGTSYTYSIFAKAAERTKVFFGFDIGSAFSNFQYGLFDLSAGTSSVGLGSPTLSITPYPNGWYKCSVTAAATGTATATNTVQTYTTANGYIGNGTSGIFIWGAQLEQGSFPTSYIPTVASTRTRAADNASITGKNFSEWYRQDEGSIHSIISLTRQMTNAGSGTWTLDNGNFGRGFSLYHTSAPNVRVSTRDAVINQSSGDISSIDLSKLKSCTNILKSATSESISCHNGSFTGLATYSLDVDISRLLIGLNNIVGTPSNNYLNGHIQQLTYFPKRLPNAQLQTLTS